MWEATTTRALLSHVGTKARPAVSLTVRGLTLRDTLRTDLDPHGMPSGGDWALQRNGAASSPQARGRVARPFFTRRCDQAPSSWRGPRAQLSRSAT